MFVVILTVTWIFPFVSASANIHGDSLENLIEASTEFAVDLYREIVKRDQVTNVVFSPVSVAAALAMLKVGTSGNSTDEIDRALHLSGIESSLVNSAFGELNGLLFDKPQMNITLKGANGAFISKRSHVLKDYSNALAVFGAEIQMMDFSDAAASVAHINQWISDKTGKLIPEMLDKSAINDVSSLMLANTLYFSGEWHSGFNPKMTEERAFYVSHYKVIKTPFMFQRGKFKVGFVESMSLQVLEMPYVGQEISLIILLPEHFDLGHVEKNLNHQNLDDWMKDMDFQTVDLTLPRFKIEGSVELKDPLQRLGVESIFDPAKADLSGITGDKSQYVDKIVHRGVLEVTEDGSTAAAATTVRIVARSIQLTVNFLADHPFVWMLRHRDTGHVLFIGRFTRPNGLEVQPLGGSVLAEREEAQRTKRSEMVLVYADHPFVFVIKNMKTDVVYLMGALKRPAGREMSHDEL